MTPGSIFNALKGISGEFEINRLCGAFGTVAYTVAAIAFVAWNMANGHPFNITEFCLAYPGGLAVCVGAIAGAVAVKDRNVATAQVVRDTGSLPGNAANAPTDAPAKVEVVNRPDAPVPVETAP